MWYFNLETGAKVFYISKTDTFFIGRNAEICDYVLQNDTSISRRHVAINSSNETLSLTDLGSKYGTYINENIETNTPITINEQVVLNVNDRVRFGILNNVWILQKFNIDTCVSTLKGENFTALTNVLEKIGGTLHIEWSEECEFLTMPAITLTVKVLYALVSGAFIVSTQFWDKCFENISQNEALPDPKSYLPNIIEPSLYSNDVSFSPNNARKTLFLKKKVIFFSRSQMEQFKPVLLKSCANVMLLSETKMTKSKLCGEEVIVIEYKSTGQSQQSQSQLDVIRDLVNYLKNKSLRVIPDTEISLAILYCSLEKHCNPRFHYKLNNEPEKNSDKSKQVLAPETQEPSTSGYNKNKDKVIIDESLTVNEKDDITLDSMDIKLEQDVVTPITKRRLADNNASSVKKPKQEDSAMFDFIDKDQQYHVENTKKQDLVFMKPKKRKNNNIDDNEDIFNFLPESKKAKDDDQDQPKLEKTSNLKAHKNTLPQDMQNRVKCLEVSNTSRASFSHVFKSNYVYDIKYDESGWKVSSDNKIKDDTINDLEKRVNLMALGKTVVTVRDDLVIPQAVQATTTNSDTDRSVTNYKRFKKVWPLQMQVTIVPTTSYQTVKPISSGNTQNVTNESSEDEEMMIKSTREPRKQRKKQIHL